MRNKCLHALALACAAFAGSIAPAGAQSSPLGVWIDHTGRGGVEITECGPNLCGRLVWLKDARNKSACGTQILGNVKPVGPGIWDKGWIYDPEERSRYDVELKPVGADKLRVVGYMGSKFLSETMMWKRAPVDLQRCGAEPAKSAAAAPAPAPVPAETPAPVAKAPADETQRPASAPEVAEAKPAPVEQAEAPPAADEPAPKPRKSVKQRTAKRECRLDLPYIKVTYPCID